MATRLHSLRCYWFGLRPDIFWRRGTFAWRKTATLTRCLFVRAMINLMARNRSSSFCANYYSLLLHGKADIFTCVTLNETNVLMVDDPNMGIIKRTPVTSSYCVFIARWSSLSPDKPSLFDWLNRYLALRGCPQSNCLRNEHSFRNSRDFRNFRARAPVFFSARSEADCRCDAYSIRWLRGRSWFGFFASWAAFYSLNWEQRSFDVFSPGVLVLPADEKVCVCRFLIKIGFWPALKLTS